MILNLFLIILIALIIIFSIILYNGLRILLTVEKEKGTVKYKLRITVLKIPIFTKEDIKGNGADSEPSEDEEEDEEEAEDEKGLKERYNEIKPILKELKKSKKELKKYLKDLLKSIDIKRLEGHLILGLSDSFSTIKIASWIWSIGAIVNSKEPISLTVEPRFTEIIIDFEGKLELKVNLMKILFYSLILISNKNIIELIKVVFSDKRAKDKEKESSKEESESKTTEKENSEDEVGAKKLGKESEESEPQEESNEE